MLWMEAAMLPKPNSIEARLRAFSLIELIVVIAIIALLMGILLPVIFKVRAASQRTVCASNLSQVGKAIYAYANDNHTEIPCVYGLDHTGLRPISWFRPVVSNQGDGSGGMMLLVTPPVGMSHQTYFKNGGIFVCPGQRAVFPIPQARTDDFLHAPHNGDGMSYQYFYVPRGGDSYDWWHLHPGQIPASWNKGEFQRFERHSTAQRGTSQIAILAELTANRVKGRPAVEFHGPGGNVLYLDGHVNWVSADAVREEDPEHQAVADEVMIHMASLDQLGN
jgi:prepilin-type N-terminal cleavage/methylation domain-containing protein/prepilin-type processing-associated H-X9-DG protein